MGVCLKIVENENNHNKEKFKIYFIAVSGLLLLSEIEVLNYWDVFE
jgi:hypothetical protein